MPKNIEYEPEPVPEIEDTVLADYLNRELQRIASAPIKGVLLDELNVAPERPREGMIVLADGTNWNPGSGAGYYGYRGGSWVLLG